MNGEESVRRQPVLIELFAAITIMCLAITLMLPLLAHVRGGAAQRTSCAANLRKLTAGFLQYAQDYDGALPGTYCGGGGNGNRTGGWIAYDHFPMNAGGRSFNVVLGSVYPYVKERKVYVCPDDEEGARTGDSYAMNSCTVKPMDRRGIYSGKPVVRFDNPQTMILIGEEAAYSPEFSSTDDAYLRYQNNIFSERHGGGANVSFVDGHVDWKTPEQIRAQRLQTQSEDGRDCPQ